VTRRTRRWAILLAVVLVVSGEEACNGKRAPVATDTQKAPTVKDDSEGLLLTWIDDKGDFHVETRVADVPMMGRDAVRVVDPGIDDGSHGDRVFAADLRQTRPDGTYLVRTMARTEFEAIAVARREKGGPTLASGAPPSGSAAVDPPVGTVDAVRRGPVIIYGAEWCGACHDAARYLRQKGVAYVEKDIEKDTAAAREMQQKLAKRGLNAGSIPVLDVRGKVMVGFSPAEVDAALGAAL
jgi:glutaredoxin